MPRERQHYEDPPEAPKITWKVEFWEENREQEPVWTEYTKAKDGDSAKKNVKWRAIAEARKTGKCWVSHLFGREDVLVTAMPIRRDPMDAIREKETRHADVCLECGSDMEHDYCQKCGWHRESWLDRAQKDKG